MAFGFIKKVFSFGKKEVVEERPAEDAPLPPIDWKSLESLKEGEESVSSAPPETPVPQPTPEEPTPPPRPRRLLLRLHPSPFLHLNLSPSLRLRLSR
jgi:fused signal recognition particle receptor